MADHTLSLISTVKHHTVGWKEQPGGGRTPIREMLTEPHHRWYCSCGAVSRKYPSEKAAFAAFLEHQKIRLGDDTDVP